MIRDNKMIELVAPEKEPITPYVKKVRCLFKEKGVSSILVIGGSGDYLDVADTVIMMNDYRCLDVSDRAKEIVAKYSITDDSMKIAAPFGNIANRYPTGEAFRPNNKVIVRSKTLLSYGDIDLDLSGLEQIVTSSQTQAISCILQMIPSLPENSSISEIVHLVDDRIDNGGMVEIDKGAFNGGMARPRIFEIAVAVNRLRNINSIIQNK